ncbi:protein-(glutamine-N5) methyltransferase [Flavobacterium akiainvivens]|uniref:Release factor glutamine methyltransferase n=1 Tax=Flavobacterium akiainvivens TaxID=1202724 RepID=A0A0M8MEN0_9FLAO|nr:peptide chain release factor N(5)-glutamine methyltransferase [Flavobacterium akiainvivens]KOS04681.1 protein-(glutamine-N5) methyltransferase [Flavobacterium akiainvivens]SFQ65069.1 release factor glutamine methyltransferase [Flavobacterium akiainvivens]
MTFKDYRSHFIQTLMPLYDEGEAERFFYITLQELKGWRRVDFALNTGYLLADTELSKWNEVCAQLQQQKPIQYIFGHTWFYGLQFKVNEHTLIPRPETEELADWIIVENAAGSSIVDIGTGSGCIAITLAKNIEGSEVSAMDISTGAIEVATANAAANGVSIQFILQDVLALSELPRKYDVIVSNPPYVRNLEKEEIKPNVLEFEPHTALFVEDTDPLIFYRKIAQLAKEGLNPGGKLYFEINQYLGPETVELLKSLGFVTVELRKDMFGNDRMIKAVL